MSIIPTDYMVSLFAKNQSSRIHTFNRVHGIMNILLEELKLPYAPAEIFSKSESVFERLTKCDIGPVLFLDREIDRIAKTRNESYACLTMLMLMEIISTENMRRDLLPRTRYTTYMRDKIRIFKGEAILDRWDYMKDELKREEERARPKRSCTKIATTRKATVRSTGQEVSVNTQSDSQQVSAAPQSTSTGQPTVPDTCSLADFVDYIIAEGSTEENRQLKQMLQNFDYEQDNRYSRLVKKLSANIKKQQRESSRMAQQPGNTINISGSNVNNVGSQITNQQNDRRYGK